MKEVLLTAAVVLGVFWIPCGIIGIGWCVRWAIRERRWWKAANREAFEDEEYGEEVVYR